MVEIRNVKVHELRNCTEPAAIPKQRGKRLFRKLVGRNSWSHRAVAQQCAIYTFAWPSGALREPRTVCRHYFLFSRLPLLQNAFAKSESVALFLVTAVVIPSFYQRKAGSTIGTGPPTPYQCRSCLNTFRMADVKLSNPVYCESLARWRVV